MNQKRNRANEHIEEYLNYYYGLSHAPNYAVLLKGEWGCGKTWFIKKYCEKLRGENRKCLYISLYGITTFDEIEDLFFQQLHPLLSSKGMAITGKIFKGLLKSTLKIDFDNNSKDDGTINSQIPDINLPEYLKNTDETILIFDDLERCKINIENVLGYINYFVEHQGLKVIIVANEEELVKHSSDELNNNYRQIKEKLISKTFNICTDLSGALKNFINSIDTLELKNFLFNNTVIIQDLYRDAQYKNLRSLKQIIWDFERIFKVLPDKAKSKPELLQNFLQILIAFSIEIKRGTILPKNITNLKQQYSSKLLSRESSQNTYFQTSSPNQNNDSQEKKSLQILFTRYVKLNLHEPFPNEIWWHLFFEEGIIDVDELKQSVLNSKYFQDENTPNWVRLWYFSDLTDDKFDALLEKVESEYINREFSIIGEIKHVVGIFLNLSDLGLYCKRKEQILQDAKLYINEILRNSIKINLTNYDSSLYEERTAYNGLGFFGKNTREFQEFCDYLNSAIEEAIFKNMPDAGQELLKTMQDDVRKFYKMVFLSESQEQTDYDQEQTYYDIPILKHIEPTTFVNVLLLMDTKDKRLVCYALEKRYKIDIFNEKLVEEYTWLKSVRDLLISEASSRITKVSGYTLKSIAEYYLNPAIEKLEMKKQQIDQFVPEI